MSTGNPLEQLRRRMQSHATPTAFAALAEEHRRAGRLAEAIAVCRDGLERYPAYVSARVTLGRALLDSGDVDGALLELQQAVAQAPDNLAAARALESAHTARGHAPPAPRQTVPALPLQPGAADADSRPMSVVAQLLGSGPDSPQEFGLGVDWSLPEATPAPTADDAPVLPESHVAAFTAEAGSGDQAAALVMRLDDTPAADVDTLALFAHGDAPTICLTPPHLQGEEPAGIWPVPATPLDAVDDPPAPARVCSYVLDAPDAPDAPGEADVWATPEVVEIAAAEVANPWDAPTIESPLVEFDELRGVSAAEPAHEPARFEAPEDAVVEAVADVPPGDPALAVAAPDVEIEAPVEVAEVPVDEPASPFWTGLFGGEAEVEMPPPFSAWSDASVPVTDGADRSPWTDDGLADQSGSWMVPDGPSAAWALGDLHEASGADATPSQDIPGERAEAPEAPPPARLAPEPEPVPEPLDRLPSDFAWTGSVKSALGEVFARAGQGESLEPPTHASPAVRAAMADAAVEAALEDAVQRDDAPTPALASLQQMLDSVRARRAALFHDVRP